MRLTTQYKNDYHYQLIVPQLPTNLLIFSVFKIDLSCDTIRECLTCAHKLTSNELILPHYQHDNYHHVYLVSRLHETGSARRYRLAIKTKSTEVILKVRP